MKIILTLTILLVSPNSFANAFPESFVKAAFERTNHSIKYDGRYIKLDYPGGDVPNNIGVCTDVIIRSYRAIDIDLQKLIHEDMTRHFNLYPSKRIWGLSRPDSNIDHRRVPNLQVFFKRFGDALTVSHNAKDYQAGDLVTWMVGGNLPHIGIVSDQINQTSGNPMIIHNIGRGTELEDMLFNFPITGHYRFDPQNPLMSIATQDLETPQ